MATIQNLNVTHITTDAHNNINTGIAALETELQPLLINLSADERRRYGSISEQNKLLVNKVNDFAQNQPDLLSPDVDWDEFKKDYESRTHLEGLIARMQKLIDGLINAKTLHDFDNYHAALDEYSYTCYKARTATPGYENKLNEIKQFFTRSRATK